jgi:hypothetical protein
MGMRLICAVAKCERTRWKRRLCGMHYQQFRRAGTLSIPSRPMCHLCSEPCMSVYSLSYSSPRRTLLAESEFDDDPRILWICADCVDWASERLA